MLNEFRARPNRLANNSASGVGHFQKRVQSEGQRNHGQEQVGAVLLAVADVVFKVEAIGLALAGAVPALEILRGEKPGSIESDRRVLPAARICSSKPALVSFWCRSSKRLKILEGSTGSSIARI